MSESMSFQEFCAEFDFQPTSYQLRFLEDCRRKKRMLILSTPRSSSSLIREQFLNSLQQKTIGESK